MIPFLAGAIFFGSFGFVLGVVAGLFASCYGPGE